MPRCASRSLGWAVGLGLALAGLVGCLELNPHFDPDGGAICVAGERHCGADPLAVEICTADATGFEPLRTCYGGSHCAEGVCLPDTPAVPCDRVADCTAAGSTCTVAVNPDLPARLGAYCLPAPFPLGRLGGQACASHEQCLAGWCFRSVCYEACSEATDCTNPAHQCRTFDVTVDGVRDNLSILGCAP